MKMWQKVAIRAGVVVAGGIQILAISFRGPSAAAVAET